MPAFTAKEGARQRAIGKLAGLIRLNKDEEFVSGKPGVVSLLPEDAQYILDTLMRLAPSEKAGYAVQMTCVKERAFKTVTLSKVGEVLTITHDSEDSYDAEEVRSGKISKNTVIFDSVEAANEFVADWDGKEYYGDSYEYAVIAVNSVHATKLDHYEVSKDPA